MKLKPLDLHSVYLSDPYRVHRMSRFETLRAVQLEMREVRKQEEIAEDKKKEAEIVQNGEWRKVEQPTEEDSRPLAKNSFVDILKII